MSQQSDPFQRLSNEEIALIYSFLDPVSIWRFGATNKQLFSFRDLTNDQWRQKYARKYHLNDYELACYDLDWPALYINRFLKETSFMKRIEAALDKQKGNHEASNERELEIDLPKNARATTQASKGGAKNDSAHPYEDISDFMANLSEHSSGIIHPETLDASTDQADGLNDDNDEFIDADNADDNNNDEQPSVGTPPEVYNIDMDDWEMFGEDQYQGIHAKFKHMFDENEFKLMEHLHMHRLGKYLYNNLSDFPATNIALGSLSLMVDHLHVESPYCGLVIENMTVMVDNYYYHRATFHPAVWTKLAIWDKVLSILKHKHKFDTSENWNEDEQLANNCLTILLSNPIENETIKQDAGLRKIFIDVMKKCPETMYGQLKMVAAAKHLHWPGDNNEELAELTEIYLNVKYARPICIALEESAWNSDNAKEFFASNEKFVQAIANIWEQNGKNVNPLLQLIRSILKLKSGQEMFWKYKMIDELIEIFDVDIEKYARDTDWKKYQIYCILRTLNIIALEKGARNEVVDKVIDVKLLQTNKNLSYETKIEQNKFWISCLDLEPTLTPQMLAELTTLCVNQIVQLNEETAENESDDKDEEDNEDDNNEEEEASKNNSEVNGDVLAEQMALHSSVELLIALILFNSSSLSSNKLHEVYEYTTAFLKDLDVATAQKDLAPSFVALLAHLIHFNVFPKDTGLINKLVELYNGSDSTSLKFNVVFFVSAFIHHYGIALPNAEALIEDFVASAQNLALEEVLIKPKSIQLLFATRPQHKAVLLFHEWILAHLASIAAAKPAI